MSETRYQPPHDDSRPTSATEQIETSPDVVNDPDSPRDVPARADDGYGDPLTAPRTGEEIAADKMAADSDDLTEVNALGDQDAVNTSGYQYPAGAEIPSAENVRRYPQLFDQSVIDSFNVPDKNDDVDVFVDETTVDDDDGDDGDDGDDRNSSGRVTF